jgi:hypothetical protein
MEELLFRLDFHPIRRLATIDWLEFQNMSNLCRLLWPLLLPVLVYGSALFISFAHHDQYRYFRVSTQDKVNCAENSQYVGLLYDLGRPITAFLDCLQFKTVNRIQDLTWHRILTLFLILGLAYLLFIIFERRLRLSREASGLLATSICLLPGMLNFFVMTNQASAFALILGAWAYVTFDLRPRGLVVSFLFFSLALFTYPPSAFLMLALAFADFLFSKGDLRTPFKRLIGSLAVALLAGVLFYATVKFVLHPIGNYDERHPMGEGFGGGTYAFNLATDIVGRLQFFGRGLNAALNFWNIYLSSFVSLAVAGWMFFLISRSFTKENFKAKLPVALVGFCTAFAPLLFANISEILFRTLISLSIYALLVLVWLFNENFKIKPFAGWALAIFIACLSGFHLIMTARNSALEFGYIKSQIEERELLRKQILLIKNVGRGQAKVGINGLPSVTDEFNVNTTVFHQEENTFILRAALVEAGAGPTTRVFMCTGTDDCAKAEAAMRTRPNVYIMDKGPDFSGYAEPFPVIDLEQFSR